MGVDLERAADCACFNLRKATRSLTRFYDERLRQFGITTPQFTILVALREAGEATITPLAETLVMDRTTLTRNLDRLEDEGLVESQPGKKDSRTRVISLTETGHSVLEDAYPAWEQAQDTVVDELGTERFREFLEVLDRIPRIIDENRRE